MVNDDTNLAELRILAVVKASQWTGVEKTSHSYCAASVVSLQRLRKSWLRVLVVSGLFIACMICTSISIERSVYYYKQGNYLSCYFAT